MATRLNRGGQSELSTGGAGGQHCSQGREECMVGPSHVGAVSD